ncbi:MAG: YdcF family protein [Candidatus Acidiferrales bacterium]
MTTTDNSSAGGEARRQRCRRRAFILLAILALLAAAGVVVFRGAGRWLVREDPLGKADCIVVLSGGLPYRAEAAAVLFREGYAPQVWVSRPTGPQEELAPLGIHFVGEEEYNREILEHEGVPDAAIKIFPDAIVNTEQEVEEISREARRAGQHTVIIVTSPEHTRRVKALWTKLVGREPRAIVRAAANDPFDADHWWRDTHDALAVMRESLGLLNVWAGLPVRPRLQ